MRRREGEGLWRDTGEGAEERRRERAGMREEAGTKGERAIRWLIGKKKKKEQRGRRGSGVSRARRPTFAWKSRLGGRRHCEEKKGKRRKGKESSSSVGMKTRRGHGTFRGRHEVLHFCFHPNAENRRQ